MAHEVFLSYSTDDEPVATAICGALESQQISCWMAPRDIPPGVTWAVAIINAIKESRLFILVLSETSNVSPPVLSELDSAANRGIPIIPVRIDNTQLSEAMEFYTARYQWLDARTPPLDKHLKQLTTTVQRFLAQAEAVKTRKDAEDTAKQKQRYELEAKEKARLEATQELAARTETDKFRKEVEEAREAAIKARKEAELATQEKARHEAEAAQARLEIAEMAKALEAAKINAKEIEENKEAATRAKKEAEEADREKEKHEAEAAWAKRETVETLKALEVARIKAKREQAIFSQEQVISIKKSLFRTGAFWVGFVFLLAGVLWQILNVLWPLEKLVTGQVEAFNQAFGMMVGVGIPFIVVGVMYTGRSLHLSSAGIRTWFGMATVTLVAGFALSSFLPYRLHAGGASPDSELLLPSVLGSSIPFLILGLYSLGGGLALQIDKQNDKTGLATTVLHKSVWFWIGIGLAVGGSGWQIFSATTGKPMEAVDFFWKIIFALPFTFSGCYCLGKALSKYHRNKWTWFWTSTACWILALLLSLIIIGTPVSNRLSSWLYIIFPALLLAIFPFIVFGIYCIVKGTMQSRLSGLPAESMVTTRPFLFWLGSVLFVLAQAFYWAIFLWMMPTNGIYPNLIAQIVPIIVITIIGMALIWLSQRKLRDGWFWPGSEIFAFGIGAIPQWINIYLNIELFPPQTSPHDLSDIGVVLGLTIPLMAVGALCLWKGWPRIRVKNPLGELLGFILTLSLVSLGVTIFLLAIAD